MPSQAVEITYDRSVDIVRSAIPRMAELKIPITPRNYAVWYSYLSQSNQALHQEMEEMLGGGNSIDEQQLTRLYERYLEVESENVRVAKSALSQMVGVLMSHVSQADCHYTDFSDELRQVAEGLNGEVDSVNLGGLIDRAVRATHTALDRAAELKQRFSDLAQEMQQVRGELARTQEEARTDPLTGMCNRLVFKEALGELVQYNAHDSHAPCLMLIDIDFFKRVNDTYGHVAGDHVLQAVARQITASVRGGDLVARYGGEEFAVLLRDTPRSGCQAVAENVRLHIGRSLIDLPSELGFDRPVDITVSIGGAWFREQEPGEALVERADRALYLSKEGGRNRVTWESRLTES